MVIEDLQKSQIIKTTTFGAPAHAFAWTVAVWTTNQMGYYYTAFFLATALVIALTEVFD